MTSNRKHLTLPLPSQAVILWWYNTYQISPKERKKEEIKEEEKKEAKKFGLLCGKDEVVPVSSIKCALIEDI